MTQQLWNKDDIERNLTKLLQSVPATGRQITEEGEVVNIANLLQIIASAAEQQLQTQFLTQRQERVGDIVYFGFATPGTATSAASWLIVRADETNYPEELNVEWAEGETTFTKAWDDRATYAYT